MRTDIEPIQLFLGLSNIIVELVVFMYWDFMLFISFMIIVGHSMQINEYIYKLIYTLRNPEYARRFKSLTILATIAY